MRFFQKIIYYNCYLFYKITVKLIHHEVKDVWYRNSFAFDYWKFLRSDIDITILLKNSDKRLIKEVSYTHSLFRRFLPVIGEIVFFSESKKETLLKCVNGLELGRDPILMKKFSLKKSGDHYEKIIFLHKFLIANWFKTDIDEKRPEKIDFFMEELNLGSRRPFKDLVDDLASLIGVESLEFKKHYIERIENQSNHTEFVFPNIIYCLFYNNLCYLKPSIQLELAEKKILEKTLLWELWGCYSYQDLLNPQGLKDHIHRLIDKLEDLTSPQFAQDYKKMAQDLELI